jgi:hypothetical protein
MAQSLVFHLSKGVTTIGVDACLEFAKTFLSHYAGAIDLASLELISIGSGSAAFESLLRDLCGVKIVAVDPAPLSFGSAEDLAAPFIEPTCATAADLRLRPDPCLLLFNWCEPNDSTYDAEALQLLKPEAFLVVYELCDGGAGAAGSKSFFAIIHDQESPYRLVGQIQGVGSAQVIWGTTIMDVRMQWWERKDTARPGHYDSPEIEEVDDQGCVVC